MSVSNQPLLRSLPAMLCSGLLVLTLTGCGGAGSEWTNPFPEGSAVWSYMDGQNASMEAMQDKERSNMCSQWEAAPDFLVNMGTERLTFYAGVSESQAREAVNEFYASWCS